MSYKTLRFHTEACDVDQMKRALSRLNQPETWQSVPCSRKNRVLFDEEAGWYFKCHLRTDLVTRLKNLFRGDMAFRMRRSTQLIQDKGLFAPSILASGVMGKGRSFVVMEAAQGFGAKDLISTLFHHRETEEAKAWGAELFHQLGSFLASVHASGLVHGDFAPNNLILDLGEKGITPYLIDNERTRRNQNAHHWYRNLVQFLTQPVAVLSLDHREAFLKGYYGRFQLGRSYTVFHQNVEAMLDQRLAKGNKLQVAADIGDAALGYIGKSLITPEIAVN